MWQTKTTLFSFSCRITKYLSNAQSNLWGEVVITLAWPRVLTQRTVLLALSDNVLVTSATMESKANIQNSTFCFLLTRQSLPHSLTWLSWRCPPWCTGRWGGRWPGTAPTRSRRWSALTHRTSWHVRHMRCKLDNITGRLTSQRSRPSVCRPPPPRSRGTGASTETGRTSPLKSSFVDFYFILMGVVCRPFLF